MSIRLTQWWFDPNPYQSSWDNPVAYMQGADQKSVDNKVLGSFNADIKLHPDLTLKSRLAVDLTDINGITTWILSVPIMAVTSTGRASRIAVPAVSGCGKTPRLRQKDQSA
jgi:hypothetical protein